MVILSRGGGRSLRKERRAEVCIPLSGAEQQCPFFLAHDCHFPPLLSREGKHLPVHS